MIFSGENMGINEVVQIGNKIRKLRSEKGFTQKEMASLTGIPHSTYSNYENNNREPSSEQLEKIANVLGISLEDLIFRGEISTELNFSSDEEAALFIGILANLEKMNIDGVKETGKYTEYLLTDVRYIKTNQKEPEE